MLMKLFITIAMFRLNIASFYWTLPINGSTLPEMRTIATALGILQSYKSEYL